MNRQVLMVLMVLLAATVASSTIPVQAQQVLEIDYEAGRAVIDDEERGILGLVIDHDLGVLYARDLEEPEGIMAFSLTTGEWIRTYQFLTGGGPAELPQGFAGLSVASGGRLYVSGLMRVIEFGATGEHISTWTPNVPQRKGAVCGLDGQPSVPTFGGVLRRGADGGRDMMIGGNQTTAGDRAEVDRLWTSRIACTTDAAYVVSTYSDGSDSVFVYHRSGEKGRLQIPRSLAEGQAQTVGPRVTTDPLCQRSMRHERRKRLE